MAYKQGNIGSWNRTPLVVVDSPKSTKPPAVTIHDTLQEANRQALRLSKSLPQGWTVAVEVI